MAVTARSGSPAGSTTAGIAATCSAPAAVTRRCQFPASSSLSPAESANRATAVCTRAAPALILNWTNPSLPRQIKGPPGRRGALPRAEECDLSGLRLEGRGGEECCSVGRSSAVPCCAAAVWASPLPAVPLSFLSYLCVCVCVYAPACVYI